MYNSPVMTTYRFYKSESTNKCIILAYSMIMHSIKLYQLYIFSKKSNFLNKTLKKCVNMKIHRDTPCVLFSLSKTDFIIHNNFKSRKIDIMHVNGFLSVMHRPTHKHI